MDHSCLQELSSGYTIALIHHIFAKQLHEVIEGDMRQMPFKYVIK